MSGTKSGNMRDRSFPPKKRSFGVWLKHRRVALDMTQRVLALEADCSARTIRQLEADQRRPSRKLTERLALALGILPTARAAFIDFARGRLQDIPSTLDGSVASLTIERALPVPAGQLIGRDETITALSELLRAQVRLLTLVGPPGVGKTSLALHVAVSLANEFRAGACFVELAAIHNSAQVIPTIAAALGLREEGTQSLAETLMASLRDSQVLLVLDNFEQVSAAAPAVSRLLAEAPDLKVLVTSRTVLHVSGEQTFRVMPLPLPELSDDVSLESLQESPAVTLFIQRARATNPDLALDLAQMRTIAEICVRLDGLPLAIELAAARLNTLSPLALLQRLDQRLDLLRWSMVDSDSRHQTLRGAILWSHDLLNSEEKALFRRLGVFAGGCTLEAAHAVCGMQSAIQAEDGKGNQISQSSSVNFLDNIGILVDHNLVQQTAVSNGDIRFTMLESLRTFALEQIEKFGETAQMRRRHAEYYLHWTERVLPWLDYPDQQAVDKLNVEYQNCLAALSWSLTDPVDEPWDLQLALSLYPYWHVRGYLSEGRQWLKAAITRREDHTSMLLARAQACAAELARLQDDYSQTEMWANSSWSLGQCLEDTDSIALALVPLGWIEFMHNHLAAARQQFESSLQLFRGLEKPVQIARVLHDIAYLAMVQGNYSEAVTYYEEELTLSKDNAHQQGVFWALHGMAWIAESQGDWHRAKTLYSKCLILAQDLRHADGLALALSGLAAVARAEGKYGQAIAYCKESEHIWRRLGYKSALSVALQEQGTIALHQGDIARTALHLAESLKLNRDMMRTRSIVQNLVTLAAVACAIQEYVPAVRLLGSLAEILAKSHQVMEFTAQQVYDRSLAEARAQLAARMFDSAWAAGQALQLNEAITEGLSIAALARSRIPDNNLSSYPAGLTPREVEVLRLVAQGLTNAQIAIKLAISVGTVNAHMTSLYRKLNTSSRAVATRYAVEHGLA